MKKKPTKTKAKLPENEKNIGRDAPRQFANTDRKKEAREIIKD